MTAKLMKRQSALLDSNEKQIINVFFNVNNYLKKENEQKQQEDQKQEEVNFLNDLAELKMASVDNGLFEKIIKIHDNAGLEYAKKYFLGFLEYKGVSNIKEYLRFYYKFNG